MVAADVTVDRFSVRRDGHARGPRPARGADMVVLEQIAIEACNVSTWHADDRRGQFATGGRGSVIVRSDCGCIRSICRDPYGRERTWLRRPRLGHARDAPPSSTEGAWTSVDVACTRGTGSASMPPHALAERRLHRPGESQAVALAPATTVRLHGVPRSDDAGVPGSTSSTWPALSPFAYPRGDAGGALRAAGRAGSMRSISRGPSASRPGSMLHTGVPVAGN